jgi:phage shock protein C
METNRLHRNTNESVIGGVSAGFAEFFGIDKALVRILFVLSFFFAPQVPIVFIYIILWIALPKNSTSENKISVIN